MRKRVCGFSLIELMIVVAVIGILAAIGYPAYTDQVRKARRTEAKTFLLGAAAREERRFTNMGNYTNDMTVLGYANNPELTEDGWYSVAAATPTATTFTLTATPQNDQATDGCGNFTLTQAGVKGVSGTLAATDCW
ncbi:MAG: type IV pilin protein [Pseudomonadota bacterium]|nr:type IV pilin protein [Pseudomonadota bacterium]